MAARRKDWLIASAVFSIAVCLHGQYLPAPNQLDPRQATLLFFASVGPVPAPFSSIDDPLRIAPVATPALFEFEPAEIKFQLSTLMNLLRDRQHEGWVLTAYPDPKTHRPLIGAGFSLDVKGSPHPQPDALNSYQFREPSSAQLWQAAGLDPERLVRILGRFHREQAATHAMPHRRSRKRSSPAPDLTEQEAMSLLRISAIQAISNARAYCRSFNQLTAAQQLGLSQLVFQMGVNLEQFVQFLGTLNADFASAQLSQLDSPAQSEERWQPQRWSEAQSALIDSQWARLYSGRAASVIAMFDPAYGNDPYGSQQRVMVTLQPAVIVRNSTRRSSRPLKSVSYRKRPAKASLLAHAKRQRS